MTEYYDTRAGRVAVVQDVLRSLDFVTGAEDIVQALYDYSAQFAVKCSDTFCPVVDKTRPNVNKLRYPGFATQEALERHRLVDHDYHDHYRIQYNVIRNPWYVCTCGHYDSLNEDELELYELGKFNGVPQSRKEHLEQAKKLYGNG